MSDYSALSDKELLRNDPPDSAKLAELISRYMKMVFACAKRYSGAADYEELVSDGMEGLLSAVRTGCATLQKGRAGALPGWRTANPKGWRISPTPRPLPKRSL